MGKVYLIITGYYSDKSVRGVYDNRELADKVCDFYNRNPHCKEAYIEEYILNEQPYYYPKDELYVVNYRECKDDRHWCLAGWSVGSLLNDISQETINELCHKVVARRYEGYLEYTLWVPRYIAKTEESAIKIAQDRLAQWKAESAGIA